ncbi:hypothetical protein BLAT2472_40597 [Burkholderia latens]
MHHRLVYWRWSPQQIAARLRRMHPDDPDQRASHETIYAAIYAHPRGGLKQAMIEALRQRYIIFQPFMINSSISHSSTYTRAKFSPWTFQSQ